MIPNYYSYDSMMYPQTLHESEIVYTYIIAIRDSKQCLVKTDLHFQITSAHLHLLMFMLLFFLLCSFCY